MLEENLKIRGRKDSKVRKPSAVCHGTFKSIYSQCWNVVLCFIVHGMVQLEVVALLFSDVLLMTKVQKKGERLKVVRPPLALDRTYCLALKDGCE